MSTPSRPSTFQPAAIIPWLLNLATRMLARSLNMPEPLVHSTGVFVFAHVQTFETQRRQDALPGPPAASPANLVPPSGALNHPRPPTTRRTTMIQPSLFLRRALLADAIVTGAVALLQTFGAGLLAPLLNLPAAAAARNRPVSDRLHRAGRLARHKAIDAEGAGGHRDCRQRGLGRLAASR